MASSPRIIHFLLARVVSGVIQNNRTNDVSLSQVICGPVGQMADPTLPPGDQTGVKNSLELDGHLERMIEDMENISGTNHEILLSYVEVWDMLSSLHRPKYNLNNLFFKLSKTPSTTLRFFCPPAVQLTWMAYDMSALRTNPELWDSMLLLEEACQKSSNAVAGGGLQEPAPTDSPRSRM